MLKFWTEADAKVAAHVRELLQNIITACHSRLSENPTNRALLGFLLRNANSWRSLCILLSSCKNDYEFESVSLDCAAIIRCMFDAYIQAAYIFHDPSARDNRALLYLTFEHIERYKQMRPLMTHSNKLSQIIQNSPKRQAGEANSKAQYDRVKGMYPKPDGKCPRNQWYEGNLSDLATSIGKSETYDWFVKQLNSSIHSGPFAVFNGPALPGNGPIYIALSATASTAQLVVTQYELHLSPSDEQLLQSCAGDILNADRGSA